jgi:DNA-binding GntR family transcriptional regulator
MGLDRALSELPCDRGTENAVRDVLKLMTAQSGHRFTAREIAGRLSRSEDPIKVILSTLAAGHVLEAEGNAYAYERDPALELDVKRFMQRSEVHNQLAQDNLARFRDRYGGR